VTRLRPGHADLAGALKFGHDDVRDVIERASARETAARVAAGAVAKALLRAVGTEVRSETRTIGEVSTMPTFDSEKVEASEVRCADAQTSARMVAAIAAAREAGDTLGGIVALRATGVVPGLGSFAEWDRRLGGPAHGRALAGARRAQRRLRHPRGRRRRRSDARVRARRRAVREVRERRRRRSRRGRRALPRAAPPDRRKASGVNGAPRPPRRRLVQLFLVGPPGIGKSSVAPVLARHFGAASLETDREIERRARKSCKDVIEQDGMERFRELESEVLMRLPR